MGNRIKTQSVGFRIISSALTWVLLLSLVTAVFPFQMVLAAEPSSIVVTTVDDTEEDEGKISLRKAVEIAKDGDLITFDKALFDDGSGGFKGINIELKHGEISFSKELSIIGCLDSDDEPAVNVLGDNQHHVFNYSGIRNFKMYGIKVENGRDDNIGGGGVYTKDGDIILTNCYFTHNAGFHGGGVCSENGNIRMTNCIFKENISFYGGGVYTGNGYINIINCDISLNGADEGGAVYSDKGDIIAINCMISGNGIHGAGGALAAKTKITLLHTTVVDSNGGTGLFLNDSVNGRLSLWNSIVAGNTGGSFNKDSHEGRSLVEGITVHGQDGIVTYADIFGSNAPDENGRIQVMAGGLADGTASALTAEDLSQAGIKDLEEQEEILAVLQTDLSGAVRGGSGKVTYGALETFKINQDPLSIEGGDVTGTYGDGEFALNTAGGSGEGEVTWDSSNNSVATVDENGLVTIIGAGETTITVTKAGDDKYYEASGSIKVNISKAELTIKAKDETVNQGDKLPRVIIFYSGFKGSDTAENAFSTQPVAVHEAANTNTPGSYKIYFTTKAEQIHENYSIIYNEGTLTVTKTETGTETEPETGGTMHTVAFESNGGSAVASQSVKDGNTIAEPIAPKRAGYTFTGWYTDMDCKVRYGFLSPVTGDLTLYAGWTKAVRTIMPYVAGYPDRTFRPNEAITRAEAAQMLYNLRNAEKLAHIPAKLPTSTDFPDVKSGAWYYDAVKQLATAGIISGYPEGVYRPNAKVSRAEFTTLVVKYMGVEYRVAESFPDVSGKHWAEGFIFTAKTEGLVSGYPDGTFGPQDNITRAQAVVIFNNMMNRDTDPSLFKGLTMPFSDVPESHWAYWHIMAAAVKHTV